MTVIDYDRALLLLEKARDEVGPGHVYVSPLPPLMFDEGIPHGLCVYFNPATRAPSCIVGHVLAYEGVTLDGVERHNESSVHTLAASRATGFEFTEKAVYLLNLCQDKQDCGEPWGKAIADAVAFVTGSYDWDPDTEALLEEKI